jgi:REP element-mobilizing transposase RayT
MFLGLPAIARITAKEIARGHPSDYGLHAWVIMPNHVHLLITPSADPSEIMRNLKGRTARQANLLLNRAGQRFWQEESYDHLIRNEREFQRIERYIVENPVTAGLAHTPEEYPWSSASGLKPAAG